MEQLYVFGTGNAAVIHYYNTCFSIRNEDRFFMVDAGGGNGILQILDKMNVQYSQIHDLFVTHEHTDHLLGVVWMVRFIATRMLNGTYDGDLNIYCHDQLTSTIDTFCRLTLQGKFYRLIGDRIHLIPVHDGETLSIMDYEVTFFDIHSTKARQFGFTTTLKKYDRVPKRNPRMKTKITAPESLRHQERTDFHDNTVFLHSGKALFCVLQTCPPYARVPDCRCGAPPPDGQRP